MRVIGKLFLFLILITGVSACFDPPNFSNTPVISSPSLRFFAVDSQYVNITVHFTDGDGDIGLDAAGDNSGPFSVKYYVDRKGNVLDPGPAKIENRYVSVYNSQGIPFPDTLLSYLDLRKGLTDTLPGYTSPYDCISWEILTQEDDKQNFSATDTVYQIFNKYNNNFFVRLLVKGLDPTQPDVFLPFSFTTDGRCSPKGFDGRVPIVSSDLSKSSPLEGDITYSVVSAYWYPLFGDKVLKFQITLVDRALHESAVLTTSEFTLDQIR